MKRHGGNKCILNRERSQSDKATCHMIPSILHSGKGKTVETVKRSGFFEGWKRKVWWISGAQRIFLEVKMEVDTIILLSTPIECITSRVKPKVNCGLWEIIMDGCSLIFGNKGTFLVSDVDNEGGHACMGLCGGTLVLSYQFCYKPKTGPPKGSPKKGGMMALSVYLSISSLSAQMVPLSFLDVSSSSPFLDLQLSFLM